MRALLSRGREYLAVRCTGLGEPLAIFSMVLGLRVQYQIRWWLPCVSVALIAVLTLAREILQCVGHGDPERKLRWRAFETNYFRDTNWIVEVHGVPMARLSECRRDDMFWYSYRVEPLVGGFEREQILQDSWWWGQEGIAFRCEEVGIVAPTAFASAGAPWNGRIGMRAMFLFVGEPTMSEQMLLWWRRRQEQRFLAGNSPSRMN